MNTASAATGTRKPKLSISQIINMSVGFFGIQFGWDLQRANMGPIYDVLGAHAEDIPLLFLAAPLTGLLVQPSMKAIGKTLEMYLLSSTPTWR